MKEISQEQLEEVVIKRIQQAPSWKQLVRAYKSFRKSLSPVYGPEEAEHSIKNRPISLLTAHAGVMDAKSSRAKTLRRLADAIFSETGLPRLPVGEFRGENTVDFPTLAKQMGYPESYYDEAKSMRIYTSTEMKPMLESAIDYDRHYSLEELRQMCSSKGLSASGDKKTLARRLIEAK